MEAIIDSILQTDTYKLSMQQCVFHQYPQANVKYVFKCRNEGIKLGFLSPLINEQIESMANLNLTQEEEFYLREKLPFLSDDYILYLRNYRFNPKQVKVEDINEELLINIDGPWVETILYEVPLLAIVNELYFKETSDFKSIEGEGIRRLKDKMNLIRQYPTLHFAEFGTRRRYSEKWQKYVIEDLHRNCPQLVGTSNVKMAMNFGIKAVGTMGHEFFSAHLALVDKLESAQKRAMHVWLQEYGENLGTVLSDTFTTDAFFRDFDVVLSKTFSGLRQDSGNPYEFGEKAIKHYRDCGIDPRTKTIIFSDSLDVPKMIDIYKKFVGRIGVSFGVGTNISNDLGITPLNIVIKLVECNGRPVVKLSDNVSKAIGDEDMVKKVKMAYGVK